LVYIDETGIDYCHRRYAKSERGKPAYGAVFGKNHRQYSVIGAYNSRKLKAPFVFEGAVNTELFNKWIKGNLLPELEKGQTVIMDNASFHKSADTERLIKEAGCELLYLPPYSPDLNPIEKVWGIIKSRLRAFQDNTQNLLDNLCFVLTRFTLNQWLSL